MKNIIYRILVWLGVSVFIYFLIAFGKWRDNDRYFGSIMYLLFNLMGQLILSINLKK